MFKISCYLTPGKLISATFAGILLSLGTVQTSAQTTLDVLHAHPEYTSSNYLPYPAPDKSVKYTKAPKGYRPFYISHYGRHGSRYHHSADEYKYLLETLAKADSAGVLTEQGKYLLVVSQILNAKAAPRAGDLTQVGAAQLEGIANRMVKNFPELFKTQKVKGKKVTPSITAYASTSGRCIMSMAAFTGEMKAKSPDVHIRYESGKSLMDFICPFNWNDLEYSKTKAYTDESDKLWTAIDAQPLMNKLFKDSAYVAANIDKNNFYNKLYEINSSMMGMDSNLVNTIKMNLCDFKTNKCNYILDSLFTVEESITRWQAQNAWWYSLLGTSPLINDPKGIGYGRNILQNIIDEASRAISGKGTPVATLRFGHDAGILPLAALMQLDLASAKVSDLSKLYEQWNDFKIIPMAANLQVVFYKNDKPAKKKDATEKNPILVKFLYNEREVSAPIPCNAEKQCPLPPYYRWDDVKNFYGKLLTP